MAATTENTTTFDPKYDDYDFPTTAPESQPGHPGHTTPEQDAKVHQLRSELEQLGYTERLDTLTMLRFLRARKFNVEAAKTMFVECEKWRKEFGTDSIARTFEYTEKPEVFKYYPQYYHKTDKDGRPVYIEKLGKIDLNAMYKITTADRMLQNLVTEYEKLADPRLPACSRKAGKLLETCCTIMDLKGVGITSISSVYQLYLINAPWGFSGAFSVVKSFLDPVTVEKIHILGSNYKKELLAQVPAENLPVEFGGTCQCPGGCELSDMGPWQEAEWAKPPKWATPKEGEESVIKNEDSGIEKKDAEAPSAAEPAAPSA